MLGDCKKRHVVCLRACVCVGWKGLWKPGWFGTSGFSMHVLGTVPSVHVTDRVPISRSSGL